MRRTACVLGLLTLSLILAGCGRSRLQSKLVGFWAARYGAIAWEIKDDGTVRVLTKEDNQDKVVDSGTYKVLDGETIETHWANGDTERLKIRFNDTGGMIMTLPDKSERVFTKVEGVTPNVGNSPAESADYEQGSEEEFKESMRDKYGLFVFLGENGGILLNGTYDKDKIASDFDTAPLERTLREVFDERQKNGVEERKVWIIKDDFVAKEKVQAVIQAVKSAGANPIKVWGDPEVFLSEYPEKNPNSTSASATANANANTAAPSSNAPISGGVLNSKAINLPKPTYPPMAKAAHASGIVTVQVSVDETGKVVAAHAVGGHPLLQKAAVDAAYQARFDPTLLSGRPVKVTGVLTYNFAPE